jgi:hypothetical protein
VALSREKVWFQERELHMSSEHGNFYYMKTEVFCLFIVLTWRER